jgi:hypothetical protein
MPVKSNTARSTLLKLGVLAAAAIALAIWWWPTGPGDPMILMLGRSPSEDATAVRECAAATIQEASRRGMLLEIGTVGRPAHAKLVAIDMNAKAWSTKETTAKRAAAVTQARATVERVMHEPRPSPGASDQFAALSVAARHLRSLDLPQDARPVVVLCADGHAVGPKYNLYKGRLNAKLAALIAGEPVPGHVDLVVGAAGLDVEEPVSAAREELIEKFWRQVAIDELGFATLTYDLRADFPAAE